VRKVKGMPRCFIIDIHSSYVYHLPAILICPHSKKIKRQDCIDRYQILPLRNYNYEKEEEEVVCQLRRTAGMTTGAWGQPHMSILHFVCSQSIYARCVLYVVCSSPSRRENGECVAKLV